MNTVEGRRYRHEMDTEYGEKAQHKQDKVKERRAKSDGRRNKSDAKEIREWKRDKVMIKVRTRSRGKVRR
jgi:hypothetical protein